MKTHSNSSGHLIVLLVAVGLSATTVARGVGWESVPEILSRIKVT
jgi:hypothetical protein